MKAAPLILFSLTCFCPKGQAQLAPNSPPGQPTVHSGIHVWRQDCTIRVRGQWAWRDATGRNRTLADLKLILKDHNSWAWTGGKLGRRADLAGASLCGADLHELNLKSALLTSQGLR
jgi:hypothetical protein